MKKSPARIEAQARKALEELTALQSGPLMLHAVPARINSIDWIQVELLRLTCKEIIRRAHILRMQRAKGCRNLTRPQTAPTPEPHFIPADSFVVFGD